MTTPLERFKDGYSNHRWNPFTDADMAIDKTEDDLYVPGSTPFVLQLLEVPRKNTPSSISIYNYNDGGYMTEVDTSPTQGQFRVDYPAPDGEGTGLIEFNSNDNGKRIRVEYKATGSPIVSEILDSKVSWPAGSPGSNQMVIFKSSVPTWAYNPVRYFHEGPALYHASGESESCFLFRFKKDSNQSKVFLELKGAKVHQGFYTELPAHLHSAGTLSAAIAAHFHAVDSHAHGALGLFGTQPTHNHTYLFGEGSAINTGNAGGDSVAIGGTTSAASPNTNTAGAYGATVSGSTAETGVAPKTYPDQFKVYLDGVDKTANILTLSGLDKLGDGTDTHAFVTTGTGELDVTSLLGGGTFHDIKITEPISAKGGRALLCLEVY
jgi:hypothetical protein